MKASVCVVVAALARGVVASTALQPESVHERALSDLEAKVEEMVSAIGREAKVSALEATVDEMVADRTRDAKVVALEKTVDKMVAGEAREAKVAALEATVHKTAAPLVFLLAAGKAALFAVKIKKAKAFIGAASKIQKFKAAAKAASKAKVSAQKWAVDKLGTKVGKTKIKVAKFIGCEAMCLHNKGNLELDELETLASMGEKDMGENGNYPDGEQAVRDAAYCGVCCAKAVKNRKFKKCFKKKRITKKKPNGENNDNEPCDENTEKDCGYTEEDIPDTGEVDNNKWCAARGRLPHAPSSRASPCARDAGSPLTVCSVRGAGTTSIRRTMANRCASPSRALPRTTRCGPYENLAGAAPLAHPASHWMELARRVPIAARATTGASPVITLQNSATRRWLRTTATRSARARRNRPALHASTAA